MQINVVELPKPVTDSPLAVGAALLAMREIRGETHPEEGRVLEQLRYLDRVDTVVAVGATREVLATASMRILETPIGEAVVSEVATLSSHRRRGLGTRVLTHLEGLARQKGANGLSLIGKSQAALFYEAMGFTNLGSFSEDTYRFKKYL